MIITRRIHIKLRARWQEDVEQTEATNNSVIKRHAADEFDEPDAQDFDDKHLIRLPAQAPVQYRSETTPRWL